MATKTINALTVTTSAAAGDFLAIWRASNGDTRKITKANFIGAILSGGYTLAVGGNSAINGELAGGGSVDTGGYALTIGGNSVINGELLGGFAGTLPADGTISLLGTAQTYSALKTFSAGIAIANETLDYYDEGTWTLNIRDANTAGGGTAATVGSAYGAYTRIGNLVYVSARISNITTTSMTGGNVLYIHGLPFASNAATNYRSTGAVTFSGVAFAGPVTVGGGAGTSYINFAETTTGGSIANLTVSDFTSGNNLVHLSLMYITD